VSAAEPEIAAPPVPALERPGSAKRAWRGAVATFGVGMSVAFVLMFPAARLATGDSLQFVVYAMISVGFGLTVVLPIVAFTLGRWLDKRSAGSSTRGAMVRFAVAGAIFAAIPVALAFTDVLRDGWAGIPYYVVVGALAGGLGRGLFELGLRRVEWRIVAWVLFAAGLAPVLWMAFVQASAGIGFAA
jgi:hypothetical protein